MKTQPQNSIEQRMRDIFTKLKGFGNRFTQQEDFDQYSLCLDKLNIALTLMLAENHKITEDKKQSLKESKHKNNQIKEIKKSYELLQKQKEDNDYEYQHTLLTQKNTISELKKKLETAKESAQYFQYEKLKEQNQKLLKQIKKEVAHSSALEEQKLKMVSLVEYNSLKEQLISSQKSIRSISNWEAKFQNLTAQNRVHVEELQSRTLKIIQLQEIIMKQKQTLQDQEEMTPGIPDEEDNMSSIHSSETCESIADCQFEDVDTHKQKKKKKHKRKGGKYPNLKCKIATIQQESEEATEKEGQEIGQCSIMQQFSCKSIKQQRRNVRSFSIVMFILAGILAIPMELLV